MTEPLLTRRAVVLAKIESTFNVDPTPTAVLDALLVSEPDYKLEVNMLERNFTRNDIDRMPDRPGRKVATMTFMHELRSNGLTNDGATECKLGRLMRACGFAQSAITAGTGQVGAVNAGDANTGPTVAWVAGGTQIGLAQPILWTIEVTLGGGSGTAEVDVTADAQSVAAGVATNQTGVAVTSGAAVAFGGGLTVAPTWTGNLVLGDIYQVWVYPPGFLYKPVSSSFESLTLYMYKDGLLHKMTGAVGTCQINGEAGGDAKVSFTFTGQYVPVVDAALPTTARYERTLPAIVELADLYVGNLAAAASAFSVDIGNDVSPRINANKADGYDGSRITRRNVTGNIDPEMELSATFDFWSKMASGEELIYRGKIGQAAGNRIWLLAPSVQLGSLSYGDREQILTIDTPLMLNRKYGNDSVMLFIS